MEEWRKGPQRSSGSRLCGTVKTLARRHAEEVQDEMMERFAEFPGIDFNFSQLIRDNVEEALSGVKGANSVKLFGNDLPALEEPASRSPTSCGSVRGIQNVGAVPHRRPAQPRDRRSTARHAPLRGQRGRRRGRRQGGDRRRGVFADGRGREALRHRAAAAAKTSATTRATSAASRSTSPARRGSPAPGSRSRNWRKIIPHKPGASYIYRENNRRYIPIKFSVQGRDLASRDRRGAGQGRTTPEPGDACRRGYRIEWSGEFAQMQAANARLMWIVPLSIGLIMVLLYTAFNSIKDALWSW